MLFAFKAYKRSFGVEDDDPMVFEIEQQAATVTSGFFSIRRTLNVLSISM